MECNLILTSDGSHSLYLPSLDEHFHSVHGAIQESQHVFINSGLACVSSETVFLLEIGLGTGLNAFLSYLWAKNNRKLIHYVSVEKYPLKENLWTQLNYGKILDAGKSQNFFNNLHHAAWEKEIELSPEFVIKKLNRDVLNFSSQRMFDLLYFDAFAPSKQPEMWTPEVFGILEKFLNPGGIIVTYAAKGQVRRIWKDLGLKVERLPGPPGKWEMLRGRK